MLAGIIAGKVGTRFGVPALLLFLITGMLFGSAGLGIQYNDTNKTQFVGMIALTVILFFGGFETKLKEMRAVLGPGIMLSTVGVILTTLCLGGFFYGMDLMGWAPVHFTFPIALLLAATMSSTDSASVFALLRSKNMHLKEGLRPILELESGSNDPMAYMLTIALIQYITGGTGGSWGSILVTFLLQFSVGGLMGYIFGRITPTILNKADIGNGALYPILLLCFVFLTFSATSILHGNGYLAVYIMGVLVGNKKLVHKKSIETFFDGLTWLLQISLFIILGLFVDAHSLLPITGFAVLAGLFMIFVARPLAVQLCLIFFPSISMRGRSFLSWVGLRGAVPIIFATYPMMSQVEGAETLFNIVYVITLLSLLIQGSTLPAVARFLGLFVDAQSLLPVTGFAVLAGLFMIFVARPLAVQLSLIFFPRISMRGRCFLSWVGLRGAVPIIFATYPMMSQVEGAETLFNIVYVITLLSLLIQGSTLPAVARFLGLDEEVKVKISHFGVEIPQYTGAKMVERTVTSKMLREGNKLMELDLKEEELVILVRRGENYMVPKGKLELEVGDILLIVFEQNTEQSA